MVALEVVFLSSLIGFLLILILSSRIHKENYLIKNILKYDKRITRFSADLFDYKNLTYKNYHTLIDYMHYILYMKILKKINNGENIEKIDYKSIEKIFGKEFAKKIKKFIIDSNTLKTTSISSNFEIKFYNLLIKYKEFIDEIDERN